MGIPRGRHTFRLSKRINGYFIESCRFKVSRNWQQVEARLSQKPPLPPFSWSILNYAIRWCDTPPLPPPVLQNLAFSPRDAWILLNLPLASCTRVWTFLLVVAMDFNCIVIASLHVLRYITMIFFDDTIVEGSISFPETEGLIVDGMHF